MPTSVVVAIAAGGAGFAAATALELVAGSFAFAAVSAAVGAGVSMVLGRALVDTPKFDQQAQGRLATLRQPVTNWQWIYGQVRVGGAVTFVEVTQRNTHLHLVITLAGHEVEEIGDIWFDDTVVPLDGSGNATGKFLNLVRIKKSLGDEAAGVQPFPDLVTESDGLWTSAHCQTGKAKIYVRLRWNQTKFAQGIPRITAVVKGRKVYDPRSALTAWSDNAALVMADYLCSAVGPGFTYATEIDETQLIAAANLCDEAVQLAAGSPIEYEARYTANGVVSSDQTPRDVIRQLNTAHAGFVRLVGGKWGIFPGAYATPEATALTEDDLRAPLHITPRLSRRDLCNGVKGLYVSADTSWQPTDYPPVTSSTALAEDQGERIWRELNLPFTTSGAAAQRIAKIELQRTRYQRTLEWPGKLGCWRLKPGDVVPVSFGPSSAINGNYEVMEARLVVDDADGAPILGCDLVLRETASAVYSWTAFEEAIVSTAPLSTFPSLSDDLDITGLTATSGTADLLQNGDGTVVPRIRLHFTGAGNAFVTHYEVQFALSAGSPQDWVDAPDVLAPASEAFIFPVKDGLSYDCRIRAVTVANTQGDWAQVWAHTVVGKTEAPSDVEGFYARMAGTLTIFACDALTDADLDCVEIRKLDQGETNWDAGTVVTRILRGNTTTSAAVEPGDWTFLARALDSSGNYSSGTATYDLTITSDGFSPIVEQQEDPAWTSVVPDGYSVQFNQGNDRLEGPLTGGTSLDPGASDFSFGCWVYINDLTYDTHLWELFDWSSGYGVVIGVRQNTGLVFVNVIASGGSVVNSGVGDGWEVGRWMHLMATFDRDGLCTIYRDGVSVGTLSIATAPGFVGGGLWVIGAQVASGSISMRGKVRKAVQYSRALSATEVAQIADEEAVASGLVGQWDFTEGSGTTVADSSGNGNTLTLVEQAAWSTGFNPTFVRHHTGVLVVESSQRAAEHTVQELFEQFVPYPVPVAIAPAAVVDKLIDATARVRSVVSVRAGRDRTDGDVKPEFQVDYRAAAGSYDGFEPWTTGTAYFRYMKGRLYLDTSLGVPVVTGFEVIVDAEPHVETFTGQAIGASGTAITFTNAFHLTPDIQVTPQGTSALIPTIEGPSGTGFTAHLYNTAGTGVSGTANINAEGV